MCSSFEPAGEIPRPSARITRNSPGASVVGGNFHWPGSFWSFDNAQPERSTYCGSSLWISIHSRRTEPSSGTPPISFARISVIRTLDGFTDSSKACSTQRPVLSVARSRNLADGCPAGRGFIHWTSPATTPKRVLSTSPTPLANATEWVSYGSTSSTTTRATRSPSRTDADTEVASKRSPLGACGSVSLILIAFSKNRFASAESVARTRMEKSDPGGSFEKSKSPGRTAPPEIMNLALSASPSPATHVRSCVALGLPSTTRNWPIRSGCGSENSAGSSKMSCGAGGTVIRSRVSACQIGFRSPPSTVPNKFPISTTRTPEVAVISQV